MKLKSLGLILNLAGFVGSIALSTASNDGKTRVIAADGQQPAGPLNTMFNFCIGAGRANEGLRADWQRQLAIARPECGFKCIRKHGLFADDMGGYRETNGKPEYNWQHISASNWFLREFKSR